MRIGQEVLKMRSEEEATRTLSLRASQKTSAMKAPNVQVPALKDEKLRVVEYGFKIS